MVQSLLRRARTRVGVLLAVSATASAMVVVVAMPAMAAPPPTSGCAAVETIAVRGTTEPQGGGSIAGPLATALQQQLSRTVQTHNLVYPASANYTASVRAGVTALRARLTQTAGRCGGITFVLIGYSQGAQVIGDTLAAGSVPAAGQIKAVVFFGDPRFNAREPFDIGSYSRNRNGIFPRSLGGLNAFAGVIGSYCRADDTVCQSGASGSGHFRYAADRSAAVAFVRGEVG